MTTLTGRSDYDASIHIAGLEPGEPIFILRARDALAVDTVRAWASLAFEAGIDKATIEQALSQADRMAKWPVQKLPGSPDVTDAEAKQLRYRFRRRSWRAGLPVPMTYDEMLQKERAEEKG